MDNKELNTDSEINSTQNKEVLRVSSSTNSHKLASKICFAIRDGKDVSITAAGRWSTHQMVKALCAARERLEKENIYLVWSARFVNVEGSQKKDDIKIIETILEVANYVEE